MATPFRLFSVMAKQKPTLEQVRRLVDYDPATGLMFWKERDLSLFPDERSGKIWNTRFAGKPAFNNEHTHGYKCGRVLGYPISAHTVIVALCDGEWPEDDIDHINGDRTDNRRENLRVVGKAVNAKNRRPHSSNTSGFGGVDWCANRWRVRVSNINIGRYKCLGQALKARRDALRERGYHENHGRLAQCQ